MIKQLKAVMPLVETPRTNAPAGMPNMYAEYSSSCDHHYWYRVSGEYECTFCGASLQADRVVSRSQ